MLTQCGIKLMCSGTRHHATKIMTQGYHSYEAHSAKHAEWADPDFQFIELDGWPDGKTSELSPEHKLANAFLVYYAFLWNVGASITVRRLQASVNRDLVGLGHDSSDDESVQPLDRPAASLRQWTASGTTPVVRRQQPLWPFNVIGKFDKVVEHLRSLMRRFAASDKDLVAPPDIDDDAVGHGEFGGQPEKAIVRAGPLDELTLQTAAKSRALPDSVTRVADIPKTYFGNWFSSLYNPVDIARLGAGSSVQNGFGFVPSSCAMQVLQNYETAITGANTRPSLKSFRSLSCDNFNPAYAFRPTVFVRRFLSTQKTV
jgi:hypothetical protein